MATITGANHIALTVSDVDRSAQWYSELLGFQVIMEDDDGTARLTVLAHPSSGWVVGLREYPDHPDSPFDEFRTGLDHFAFTVPSREELRLWEGELEQRGVPFTPTVESPIGSLVAFRDPDNIQLEFFAPAGLS